MALISNGSMMLLKYKLNNVCGADNISANDAQITEQFLYTTIYCDCQYLIIDILYFTAGENANTHYLRIICVLQAHRENNAYCVRIKSVLGKYASAHLQRLYGLILLLTPCIRAAHSCPLASCGNLSFVILASLI